MLKRPYPKNSIITTLFKSCAEFNSHYLKNIDPEKGASLKFFFHCDGRLSFGFSIDVPEILMATPKEEIDFLKIDLANFINFMNKKIEELSGLIAEKSNDYLEEEYCGTSIDFGCGD